MQVLKLLAVYEGPRSRAALRTLERAMAPVAVGEEAPPQTRLSHVQVELGVHLPRAAFSEGGEAPLENFQKTAWEEVEVGVYQASPVEVGLVVQGVQERFHYFVAKAELPLQEKLLLLWEMDCVRSLLENDQ